MERIEDRSKALSFIGIEIAEALKYIPAPVDEIGTENIDTENLISASTQTESVDVSTSEQEGSDNEALEGVDVGTSEVDTYYEETRFETKPSLWQRIKNSKFVRTIRYIMQIRVVLDYPALPEGRGDNY